MFLGNKDADTALHCARNVLGCKTCRTFEFSIWFLLVQEYADSKQMPYIETSAKSSMGVEEAFLTMTNNLIATRYYI